MPLAVKLPSIEDSAQPVKYLNVLSRKKTAVQRQLRREGLGGYEPEFLSSMLAFGSVLPRGFTFLDVGSHIGLYAALLEKLFEARATAFEATPDTAEECRVLRRANGLSFDIVNAAVSNEAKEVAFYLSPKSESSNSLNATFRPGSDVIHVSATTLDLHCRDMTPHLIKIDVETHEPEVLLGGMDMIRRARPIIACEILPKTNEETLTRAVRELSEMGYILYHVSEEMVWPEVSLGQVSHLLDHAKRDWVLTPKPLDSRYHDFRGKWLTALKGCGQETNLLTPSKAEAAKNI